MSRLIFFGISAFFTFIANLSWSANSDGPIPIQDKPMKTDKYIVFTQGAKKAGEQSVHFFPNGVVKVKYFFKDNGRGPDLEEEYKMNKMGYPVSYSVKGNAMMGNTIDDHFEVIGKKFSWSSQSEKGETISKDPLLYMPLNGSLHFRSLLIGLLAKNKSVKLAPSGEVIQRKWQTVTLKAKGKSIKVQLISFKGIGLSPSFFWATVEKNPKLFAYIDAGFMWTLPEEWYDSISLLEAEQKKSEGQLLKYVAKKLQNPLSSLTVITNARLFNSETASVTEANDVYILRGRITAIKPTGSPIIGAAQKIDAGGRLLSPGLFDMHGHLWRWDGPLHLAAGVTTVRDMGNANLELQSMIDDVDRGDLLAPQVVPCGFLEGESSFSARLGFVIKDLDGAKKAIDWYAENGYPQLKIYNSFPKDILEETVTYAHARGMRVSGHIPAFLKAEQAVQRGYDEIQHINQVLLNFLVQPDTETRNLNRFYLPAEKLADLDFTSSAVKDFIKLLKDHKTVIDPTAGIFDFIKQRDGEIAAPFTQIFDHLPPDIQRDLKQGGMKIPDDATHQRYLKSYNKMVEFIGLMYKNKIPIVAGTDGMAGFLLHSELELYVKAGMTPAQALQIATLNGATYTKTLSDRGVIATGKLADLVLFDGDPTKDINDLRKVSLVITRGQLIYPKDIYTELGIKPFVTNPPKIEKVVTKSVLNFSNSSQHGHGH